MSAQVAGLIRAWNRGRDAALAGAPAQSCPYSQLNNRDAWAQGHANGLAELARTARAA
jgi:ribosome modulation factor